MGAHCADLNHHHEGVTLSAGYRVVLVTVLVLNALMGLAALYGAWISHSSALSADAVDFLADALAYGVTLAVLNQPLKTRARAALLKGGMMTMFAGFIAWRILGQWLGHTIPDAHEMTLFGIAALTVNLTSAFLLWRYRSGDANARAVWLCSRNDALNDVGVIAAAWAVSVTHAAWPDWSVALVLLILNVSAVGQIVQSALAELRHDH